MQQELINLIDELRKTGNQVAQTFTLSLAHNDMDAEMWERLCDGVKEINIKRKHNIENLISNSLFKKN